MVVKISEKAIAGRERKVQRALEKEAEEEARAAAAEDALWEIGAPGKSAREKREEKSVAKARAREERREIELRTDEPEPAPREELDEYRQEAMRKEKREVDSACYSQIWDLDALRAAQKGTCIEEGLGTIKEMQYDEHFVLRHLRFPPEVQRTHIAQQLARFNDAYVGYEKEHLPSMTRGDGENTRAVKHRLYGAFVNSPANPLFVADPDARERALWDELKDNGTKLSAKQLRYYEEGALIRMNVRRKWRAEGIEYK